MGINHWCDMALSRGTIVFLICLAGGASVWLFAGSGIHQPQQPPAALKVAEADALKAKDALRVAEAEALKAKDALKVAEAGAEAEALKAKDALKVAEADALKAKDALKVAEARCDENSARTGEPFYSAEQQARFDSYTTGVTDSGQLQELIRYAHTLFDIKELQEKLDRDGYVIFRPEVPEDIMAKAVAFTKGFLTDDPANFKGNWHRAGHACQNPETRSACIHDRYDNEGVTGLAEDHSVLALLAALFNKVPYQFQTLNYATSSLAYTHSDYVHFGTYPPEFMVGVWIALEDINPDSGPVFYYPGSHKMPFVHMQDLGLKSNAEQHYPLYQDKVQAMAERLGFKKQSLIVKKGEALLWSSNLLHGGPIPNNKGLSRLSQVSHYHFHGMEYSWQPVASRIDMNKIMYIDAVGVHQLWGRMPMNPDGTRQPKSSVRSCAAFKNSPCAQKVLDLGYKVATRTTRCPTGHGIKGVNC